MTTDRDIKAQVEESFSGWVDDFDVDGFVTALIQKYGLVHIDTIPTDEYWAMVPQFDLS